MSVISVSNLTFAYEGSYDNIFEDVSFSIDTDWKLGFTGRNGRGKTTFLKLLAGRYEYSGSIKSSVEFLYFPFEIEDKTRDTIDVVYGINGEIELWELQRELNLLKVDENALYRTFDTLSFGERTKVMLAALFLKDNGYLLIDEPTNHLDTEAREVVSSYLRSKRGFILVSHDRMFLDNCVDHILSINKTGIEIQKGNFSSWLENKERQDGFELAENEKLKKEITRLKQAAKRTSSWSDSVEKSKYNTQSSGSKIDRGYVGHKSAKMMKRSKSMEKRQTAALKEKEGLLKNIEEVQKLKIHPKEYHSQTLAVFDDVSLFYGERQICTGISFVVGRGDRIAVNGRNGSGKSSLIKLICGESIDHTGNVGIGSGIKISYVPQTAAHLRGTLTEYAREKGIDESLLKAILRKLDFSRVQFEKDMSGFSEGQKKKVLIAASLCESAHLYIWDEPLNYIDILSRMQIEELLLQYKPTMIFVEHDGAFMKNIATKTVEL